MKYYMIAEGDRCVADSADKAAKEFSASLGRFIYPKDVRQVTADELIESIVESVKARG